MAVAFDAKATTVTSQTTQSSPITNTTLTVGASGTLVIGVFSSEIGTSLAIPTAMTWNGVAMTLVSNKAASDGSTNVYVYAIVSPATGAHTLSCTYTTGGAGGTVDLDCFSFTGTDVTSVAICIPSADLLTDASSPATAFYPTTAFTVTTVSGDAIVVVANAAGASPTSANVGTLISFEDIATNNYASLRNLAVGATTQGRFALTNFISATPFCGIAFRIIQPSAGLILNAQQVVMV